ncbi:terpene cyclase/mutase family protein [Thermococcus argininiproducens]|uniref:Terpene cyclase/mutase family protein n=1 Tax=Thermococcus argininiproducens TaxID=2866384 RepID=A0A9E7MBM4_9EURY|nr:prenyltransferase/squalene oxidase repeat-containing protein [Thermococcus argininiproducens]USH00425.1 terpene cyclase/mutase family protein [Thermococcus argininiproducens]
MEKGIEKYLYSLENSTSQHLIIEEDTAYIKDPVFGIVRNRVSAEYLKSIIRLHGEKKREVIQKLVNFLLLRQNPNGSWNEIHPNYNQESALVTSFVGEALLLSLPYLESQLKETIQKALIKARDFVLSSEVEPGYFLKSKLYRADYLNVDATCGAFLAQYYKVFNDGEALEGAKRAAKRVCDFQETDGSFPYTVTKGNQQHHLKVPCIHYQGVTLYYLSKIHEVIQEEWLKECMLKGAQWLSKAQKDNGRFDWSKSGLMFAYYLTGAYAFGIASFLYTSKWDEHYLENARKSLPILKENTPDIALRWERGNWPGFPTDVLTSFKSAWIGDYALTHKLFRFGYAIYRQIARRRFSKEVKDDMLFKIVTKLLGIKASTIEPSKNFPDMFMTSEILDCLTYSLKLLEGEFK